MQCVGGVLWGLCGWFFLSANCFPSFGQFCGTAKDCGHFALFAPLMIL